MRGEVMTIRDADSSAETRATRLRFDRYVLDVGRGSLLLEGNEIALRPKTSVTKSFTAAGLAMLVDERKLEWDKPVRTYMPEFRMHDPIATERLAIRDMLTHRSGLPRHDWVHMPGQLSRAQMLAALAYLEPSRDFRAAYQYQNLIYSAAGMLAERITGQSWEKFTRAAPRAARHE